MLTLTWLAAGLTIAAVAAVLIARRILRQLREIREEERQREEHPAGSRTRSAGWARGSQQTAPQAKPTKARGRIVERGDEWYDEDDNLVDPLTGLLIYSAVGEHFQGRERQRSLEDQLREPSGQGGAERERAEGPDTKPDWRAEDLKDEHVARGEPHETASSGSGSDWDNDSGSDDW